MATMELPAPLGRRSTSGCCDCADWCWCATSWSRAAPRPEDVAAHADEADRVRAELAELLAGQA